MKPLAVSFLGVGLIWWLLWGSSPSWEESGVAVVCVGVLAGLIGRTRAGAAWTVLGGIGAMVATYAADWYNVLQTGWNVGPEVPPNDEIFGFWLWFLIGAIGVAMLVGEAIGYAAGAMVGRLTDRVVAGRRGALPRQPHPWL